MNEKVILKGLNEAQREFYGCLKDFVERHAPEHGLNPSETFPVLFLIALKVSDVLLKERHD